MQRARRRIRRHLPVGGLDVDPRRDPYDRPHAAVAKRAHHRREVRELVRVGLPGVVLRLPGGVEHDRVERDVVAPAAVHVVLDVVLVRVDVARLPEAVAPLGQHGRQAARAQVAPQPRGGGGVGEQPQAQRAGVRAGGHDGLLVAELEAHAVAVAVGPDRIAARGLKPRRGRVVALRDAPVGEQVRRAVRPGVRAVGAELDPASGMVDAQRVARAEAGEVLLRTGIPLRGDAQRRAVDLELEQDRVGLRHGHADATGTAALAAHGDLDAVGELLGDARGHDALGQPQGLARDDALGELDELILDHALDAPHAEPADQPPAVAAHVDGERVQADLDAQRPALQHEGASRRRGENRHCAEVLRRAPHPPLLHTNVTSRARG
ncbi:MAG: hypothetical protein QOJ35_1590 [Solirubrobacteraceae bacterium]|nr:hypothetical protein [Solirubrobacteraceae bacterium]